MGGGALGVNGRLAVMISELLVEGLGLIPHEVMLAKVSLGKEAFLSLHPTSGWGKKAVLNIWKTFCRKQKFFCCLFYFQIT